MSNLYLGDNKFLIIVAGPTAVGKTQLAIDLAKHYQADVFSADSRQLYREMHIGTAKPETSERLGVTHHFIDSNSIHDTYSAGDYALDIRKALETYFLSHDVAIIAGGTGLYMKVLLEGLDDFPEVPEAVYTHFTDGYEKNGIEWLQVQLKEQDPAYFEKVDPYNPRRLIRALAVMHISGKPFSEHFSKSKESVLPYNIVEILLELPREALYDRINQRVMLMLEAGLEAEAQSLLPFKDLRSLQTVGYQEFFDYFEGKITKDDAIGRIKQNTRRYAKRQMTWFRKYGNWTTFHPDQLQDIIQYIDLKMSSK